MVRVLMPLLPFVFLFLISGCSEPIVQSEQMSYEETKKMVVDILKSDEGKKAFKEVMTDDEIKQQLVLDQAVVKETIEQTLTSDKGMEFWKKAYADPKFSEAMAKSMKEQNELLLKNLMNDPEYRGTMIEVMKDPALQTEITDLLKSKEYRDHLKEIVSETFESPLYKAKMQDMLMKAAAEAKSKQGGGGEAGSA